MSRQTWSGSCFCGTVNFRVSGAPKFVAHDHCSICRRIAGAAYVTWVGFQEPQLEIASGREALASFASSAAATRQFCSRCGSHLFFRSERWPGEVHVTLASLNDPSDLAPTAHVFASDQASWHTIGDDLPRFGGASGLTPLPESRDRD